MKAIEKRTGKTIEVEPYYLDGRIIAYRGYSDLPGFEKTRQAYLPDELSLLPDSNLPTNLDEAANAYEEGYFDNCSEAKRAAYHGFKDGAMWAFSQGETYEVRVMKNGLSGYTIVLHAVESFDPDEEVIVQVRKKK